MKRAVVEDGFYMSGEGGDDGWYTLILGDAEFMVYASRPDDMRCLAEALDATIESPTLLRELAGVPAPAPAPARKRKGRS
jgi:hypothetical protein